MAGSLLIPKILIVTLVLFGMSISVISFPSSPMIGDESGKTMSLRELFDKCEMSMNIGTNVHLRSVHNWNWRITT